MRLFLLTTVIMMICSVASAEWLSLNSMLSDGNAPAPNLNQGAQVPARRVGEAAPHTPVQPPARPTNAFSQDASRQETGVLKNRLQAPDTATALRLSALSQMAERIQNRRRQESLAAMPRGSDAFPSGSQVRRNPLTLREIQYAATAWNYFRAATNAETGMVRSTLKFPSTTMWDQGGYLLALVAAQRLGLISRPEAIVRARKVINSLGEIGLVNGQFPNKAYNTETLQMTDYANRPVAAGIGYSALDIMRLVSGMVALENAYPEVRRFSQSVRQQWPLDTLVSEGRFWSTTSVGRAANTPLQEGRIGYEQYAGRVGLSIGMATELSASYGPILKWQVHDGVPLPGDIRGAKTHGVDAVTTSEPFLLEAIEFGWRPDLRQVALGAYVAQVNRFVNTGQLTALSEDHIAGPPYFAYDGILVGDRPFESVTPVRKVVNDKRRISTKAAFGWWALVPNDYGELLLEAVSVLQTPDGWNAGLFEIDNSPNEIVTLNTNAVVLEALHYKALGPIVQDF